MESRTRAQDMFLAFFVPLACSLTSYGSLALAFRSSLSLKNIEIAVLLLAGIVSTAIVIWWSAAAVVILFLVRTRAPSASAHTLPTWAPGVLRRLAIGTIGLSLISAPAHATPAEIHVSTATSQPAATETAPHPSPLTADSPIDTISPTLPFFNSSPAQTIKFTATSAQQAPLPFFNSTERIRSEETPASISASPDPSATHQVQPGESLWNIAQQQLPAHATDAEILAFTQAIYQANTHALASLDSPIHPNQVLTIPTTYKHQ